MTKFPSLLAIAMFAIFTASIMRHVISTVTIEQIAQQYNQEIDKNLENPVENPPDPIFNWSIVNFTPESGTDGFTAIHRVDDCIILAAKRSSTPQYRLSRADICKEPQIKFHPIGNIPNYTGAHTYYFGHENSTVIASTGDVGTPCIIRSTDKGLTWKTVVPSAALKTTDAVFSPISLGFGEWIIFLRDDPDNRYIMRSRDDGLTWAKDINTKGLMAGARRVQLIGKTLYYSGTFAGPRGGYTGLYTSSDGGRTWNITLKDKPIFAGVCRTSTGTELVGEYHFSSHQQEHLAANLYRRVPGGNWDIVLQGKANSNLIYFREVIELLPGHLLAFLSNNEDSQEDKDLKIYYSRDDGELWDLLPPILLSVGDDGQIFKVNAIYDALLLRNPMNSSSIHGNNSSSSPPRGKNILLAAAQPNDYILRLDFGGLVSILEGSLEEKELITPKRRWNGLF